jgi:hypothetical protein
MQSATLTIGELEAKYPLYCKAMKLLLRDGQTPERLRRTVCWERLEKLHHSLPRQYKSPERLMQIMQSEINSKKVQP